MRRTKTINEIFAPRVWRLGGASVRRAAMTLMLVMLTTMTAWAETETVSYIDANGQTQTVTATVIEAGTTYYPGGTYVIKDDVNFTSKVTFNGNTTIICVEEKTMLVTIADSETDKGIHVRGNLTLYGQGGETTGGIMVESGNAASEFIGLKVQNNLTVYGGSAAFNHHGKNGGSGIDAPDVAIYGGEISGACLKADGINSGSVYIHGGVVISNTSNGKGIRANTITLGYANADDYICVSSYEGSVSVKDGQTLRNYNQFFSGAIDDNSTIGKKGLYPGDFYSSATDEYTIGSSTGWGMFCDRLAADDGKTFFSGKTVKLGADISVSRMADGQPFTGTFDGDGHTLTLNYGTADAPVNEQFVAPFVATSADGEHQPVFRNLTIDGTIYDSYSGSEAHNVGGLIGHLYGDVTIEHCTSNLTITSVGGAGGFVGLCEHTAMFTDCKSSVVITSPGGNNSGFVSWSRASGHAISFDGCVFNGKLLQQNGAGGSDGCFIGWTGSNKTVTITNSLCALAATTGETMASGNSATFARGWNATTTATNSYYTTTLGTAQGKQARSITEDENVTIEATALTGTETEYTVSGITAYSGGGLALDDGNETTLYYGSGDQVSLTLGNIPPEGYGFDGYTVRPGGATLTGSANPYTLTMPNADVTIGATFTLLPISVSYIDENGEKQTVDAIDLSKLDWEKIPAGVYSFSSNSVANPNFDTTGDVTIIIPDDINIGCDHISGYNNVTFYGQEKGNGRLDVTVDIAGNVTVYGGNVHIEGNSNRNVTVYGGNVSIGWGVNGEVTFNGGNVSIGGNVTGEVTFNGGNVSIEGSVKSNIILSWIKPSDRFYVATFFSSVEIAYGKAFYDEDGNIYSRNSGLISSSISGKTLRPLAAVSLADNAYNTTTIENLTDVTGIDITLSGRTLWKDGDWNTLCLPFDVTVGSGQMAGATAMTLNASQSGFDSESGLLTLYFDGVNDGSTIAAGTPFIVKWTGDNVSDPMFSGVTVSSIEAGSVVSDDCKVRFQGTYSPAVIYSAANDNLYFGAENRLYWPRTEDITLGSCRAYFHVDLNGGAAAVRAFNLNFGESSETTEIISTTDFTDYTDYAGAWYTLDGRKLDAKPTKRGVYIHHGKKIVVK